MRIIDSFRHKKSRMYWIIATILVAIILPIIQTGFLQNSFKAWFLTLIKSPLNTSLYFIFSLLFGGLIGLQIYNSDRKICDSSNSKKGIRTGIFGGIFGFLVGICPACIGLLGLILPLGGSLWLTYYGWVFMLIAIGIIILSIYFLGGFKKK